MSDRRRRSTPVYQGRPDVGQVLAGLIADARDVEDPWAAYESAKAALSRTCGHDAGGRYDPDEYDQAVRFYVDAAGL